MAAKKINGQAWNGSSLTISGKTIEVTHENVSIQEVHLDPDNPRIRFQINHGAKKKPSGQAELLEIVREQPGYEDLQKQIRRLGGIFDPLIVRHNGMVVEGNTRLAAMRVLHETNKNDKRWRTVPITRLPTDVPEDTVELLKANYHVAGKTVWRPAAQADQIHRLIKELRVSPQQVADETRLSVKKVEQYVEAYEFLIKEVLPEALKDGKVNKQEILEKKFSHALEFISGKKLQSIREDAKARKSVAKLIAHDKISGLEVRKLPSILENKEAAAALLNEGFKPAKEVLKKADPTTDSKVLKTMKYLTEMLQDMSAVELEVFRRTPKARAILKELDEVLDEVVALASPKSAKRHA